MTWFEQLTGCIEDSPDGVRRELFVEAGRLHSQRNGKSWQCGEFETPTLRELRERAGKLDGAGKPNTVGEVVGNVQQFHRDRDNEHAIFQVASQFNLLEMTSPGVTPECGVGIYENDFTQGPACAIAAGAGTIFRNYFVDVRGQIGQTATQQVDCLAGVGSLLDNSHGRLWRMVNGYALPSAEGLSEINRTLEELDEPGRDRIRQALQIGLQWQTQVTLDDAAHTVSQAHCSAMPVAYTTHSRELWQPFASLILEAAYEATLCAAILNSARTGCNRLFLTLLGGGAFGNNPDWILDAIRRALNLYSNARLAISIVSYGASNRGVRQLLRDF